MSDVKSKNLYELLGNDHDQDSDKEAEPPTKAIDKTLARSGKRDAPQVEKTDAAPRNRDPERRRGGFTGNEQAFRDRATGSRQNRDNFVEGDAANGRGGRGGRGARGPRRGGDRHSRTGRGDHEKQVGHGWGKQTGEGEQADENAGDRIAAQEIKEDGFGAADSAPPVDADGNVPAGDAAAEEEPEDNNKSYTEYLAEQARKKLEGLGLKEARAPNEGSKENKKWNSAKELSKEGEEENYFIGEAKAKRERERSTKKNVLDIDYSFKEPREAAPRGRGGRGRGEGRGEFRGSRGRGEFRGARGGERGERGGERGGDRGSYRGTRGSFRGNSDGPSVAVGDESAFPALGRK